MSASPASCRRSERCEVRTASRACAYSAFAVSGAFFAAAFLAAAFLAGAFFLVAFFFIEGLTSFRLLIGACPDRTVMPYFFFFLAAFFFFAMRVVTSFH